MIMRMAINQFTHAIPKFLNRFRNEGQMSHLLSRWYLWFQTDELATYYLAPEIEDTYMLVFPLAVEPDGYHPQAVHTEHPARGNIWSHQFRISNWGTQCTSSSSVSMKQGFPMIPLIWEHNNFGHRMAWRTIKGWQDSIANALEQYRRVKPTFDNVFQVADDLLHQGLLFNGQEATLRIRWNWRR